MDFSKLRVIKIRDNLTGRFEVALCTKVYKKSNFDEYVKTYRDLDGNVILSTDSAIPPVTILADEDVRDIIGQRAILNDEIVKKLAKSLKQR